MPATSTYYASGKLLITGEYFVLGGSLALAIPTRYGQWLEVEAATLPADELSWQSLDHQGQCWFSGHWRYQQQQWQLLSSTDDGLAARLVQLFEEAERQQPGAWRQMGGTRLTTRLEFPRHWGLGSSSTLISNLSQWLGADPWALLAASFGGSGYDLACARAETAILYQLQEGQPTVTPIDWQPNYAPYLYFVYLGQKQDSRQGIQHYRQRLPHITQQHNLLSELTTQLLQTDDWAAAAQLLARHEAIVSEALDLPTIQAQRFPDFPGQLKSLGAWGGDFILALSQQPEAELRAYFAAHGLYDLLPFQQMIKNNA